MLQGVGFFWRYAWQQNQVSRRKLPMKRWTANNCIVNTGCWNTLRRTKKLIFLEGSSPVAYVYKYTWPLFRTDHKGLLLPLLIIWVWIWPALFMSPTKTSFDYYDASGSVAQINCFYSLPFTGKTEWSCSYQSRQSMISATVPFPLDFKGLPLHPLRTRSCCSFLNIGFYAKHTTIW